MKNKTLNLDKTFAEPKEDDIVFNTLTLTERSLLISVGESIAVMNKYIRYGDLLQLQEKAKQIKLSTKRSQEENE